MMGLIRYVVALTLKEQSQLSGNLLELSGSTELLDVYINIPRIMSVWLG